MPNNPNKSQPRYILNPKDVGKSGEDRIRQWAGTKMKANEGKMTSQVADKRIIASGVVEPEEIDVRAIYPFPELNWHIYKDNYKNTPYWSFVLLSKKRLLIKIQYAKF